MRRTTCLLSLALLLTSSHTTAVTLEDILSQWSVNSGNFSFPMPTQTSNGGDAANFISSNWQLSGKISWGMNDISFVQDPSGSTNERRRLAGTPETASSSVATSSLSPSSTSTASSSSSSTSSSATDVVLRIEYPQGSYSNNTGGTQFNANPISGTYERMILAYDVYFPSGYQWVQGGKLPGLRGGPDPRGCSGGNETDGTGCFSTRLMWRTNGAGEVYAYIPTRSIKNFCSESGITCNSDFGTSLARGSFSWVGGQWQPVWLVVILNEVGTANGVVELYYNGVQAISMQNLELRSASSLSGINGMFFSTFFGGSDSSWATPSDQFTYYKNMQLFAGTGAATGSGQAVGSAGRSVAVSSSFLTLASAVAGLLVSSIF